MKKWTIGLWFLVATAVGVAATYGPFTLASLGYSATWQDDQDTGVVANTAFGGLYAGGQGVLKNAKYNDSVRFIYSDGTVVQYTVEDPQSTAPLNLDKVISNPTVQGNRDGSPDGCHSNGGATYFTYNTGYWGGEFVPNDPDDPEAGATVYAEFISTGTVSVATPARTCL